jgi:hypothetical protein
MRSRMKAELTPCHLRSIRAGGYDPLEPGPGLFAVERSVGEYSLDELTGAEHDEDARADTLSDSTCSQAPDMRPADLENICANPLREEPHPAIVGAVKRFGAVGLVAGALGTGLLRWWKSLIH